METEKIKNSPFKTGFRLSANLHSIIYIFYDHTISNLRIYRQPSGAETQRYAFVAPDYSANYAGL